MSKFASVSRMISQNFHFKFQPFLFIFLFQQEPLFCLLSKDKLRKKKSDQKLKEKILFSQRKDSTVLNSFKSTSHLTFGYLKHHTSGLSAVSS